MTRTLLFTAAALLTLGACQPRAATNDAADANTVETADAANETAEAASGGTEPAKCKATEGQSKGPFYGFTAVHNLFPPVKQPSLTVKGTYFLNKRTGSATLVEKVPPGLNPTILLVDLTVSASGAGGDCVPVTARFTARQDQYKTVTVTDPSGASIDIPVEAIH